MKRKVVFIHLHSLGCDSTYMNIDDIQPMLNNVHKNGMLI